MKSQYQTHEVKIWTWCLLKGSELTREKAGPEDVWEKEGVKEGVDGSDVEVDVDLDEEAVVSVEVDLDEVYLFM